MSETFSKSLSEPSENAQLLNKVVTDPMFIVEGPANVRLEKVLTQARAGKKALKDLTFRLGLRLYATSLIRAAAHKICIPKVSFERLGGFESLVEAKIRWENLEDCPPSMVHRIEVVDKDKRVFSRVKEFVQPIFKDVYQTEPSKASYCKQISDFLYKLLLASKLGAEADVNVIHRKQMFQKALNVLKQNAQDDEIKFRVDQVYGIYKIYEPPQRIKAVTLRPRLVEPSIFERVNDLLNSAEIMELSRSRYLLGIPGKSKAMLARIRHSIEKLLRKKEHLEKLRAVTDLIQTAGRPIGISLATKGAFDILQHLQKSSYNPPLTSLEEFRMATVEISTKHPLLGYLRTGPFSSALRLFNRGSLDRARAIISYI